jgi:hypothetical protein
MGLAWKVLIPLSLGNVIAVMCIRQFNLSVWWGTAASVALFIIAGLIGTNASRNSLQAGRSAPALAG